MCSSDLLVLVTLFNPYSYIIFIVPESKVSVPLTLLTLIAVNTSDNVTVPPPIATVAAVPPENDPIYVFVPGTFTIVYIIFQTVVAAEVDPITNPAVLVSTVVAAVL